MANVATLFAILAGLALRAHAAMLLRASNTSKNIISKHGTAGFVPTYNAVTGLGIWKWSNALVAYDYHLIGMANTPVSLLEIGVQSGGSIGMWKTVLGTQCHYYGMDINPNCKAFEGPLSTIILGDQADVLTWNNFFAQTVPMLDVCCDDGGHQAHQMLTTLTHVLPHINAGGVFITEDIHGQNDDYLAKYFVPAATVIANQATVVESVHVYPFLLMVQKIGGTAPRPRPLVPGVMTSTIDELLAALPLHPGQLVGLQNPSWGSFHTAVALQNFFTSFYGMHGGHVKEIPANCHDLEAGTCTMLVENTAQQSQVVGVHIYESLCVVEVAASPPVIEAVRKGTQWIPYAGFFANDTRRSNATRFVGH